MSAITKLAAKSRPILMGGGLVKAILEGRKTITRRPVQPQPVPYNAGWQWDGHRPGSPYGACIVSEELLKSYLPDCCLFGTVGDRLWVREKWRTHERLEDMDCGIVYAADGTFRVIEDTREAAENWVVARNNGTHGTNWRPSIHMPRWASRLTLEITSVGVERLNAITESDAIAEGALQAIAQCDGVAYDREVKAWCRWSKIIDRDATVSSARAAFAVVWDKIYGDKLGCDWASNCWVWIISFSRIEAPSP